MFKKKKRDEDEEYFFAHKVPHRRASLKLRNSLSLLDKKEQNKKEKEEKRLVGSRPPGVIQPVTWAWPEEARDIPQSCSAGVVEQALFFLNKNRNFIFLKIKMI